MTTLGLRIAAASALLVGMVGAAWGQDTQKAAYMNPSLPAEQRAADLVKRMTLEEKATQLVNQARAIPRLGVPASGSGGCAHRLRQCTGAQGGGGSRHVSHAFAV